MIRLKLPFWLVQRTGLSSLLEGEIISETKSGLKFKGKIVTEPSTHCLRCGRELLIPESRLRGIGPECLEALSIREITQWFPKKHVEVIGGIPKLLPQNCLRKIWIEDDILYLLAFFEDRSEIRSLPDSRWDPDRNCWVFPNDPIIRQQIFNLFRNKLEIDPKLLKLHQEESLDQAPLQLHNYQKEGIKFLIERDRALLADEMRLGKTCQMIRLCEARDFRRVLVVCPNGVRDVWRDEIRKWSNQRISIIIEGDKPTRQKLISSTAHFKIMNYEILRLHIDDLLKMKWDAVIYDEAHRLKNRQSQVFKAARKITRPIQHVYLTTGTPILNHSSEAWSLLHLLYPKQFSSFWKFAYEYCRVFPSQWGLEVHDATEGSTQMQALQKVLDSVMIRREAKTVRPEMSEILIQQRFLRMSNPQQTVYTQMKNQFLTEYQDPAGTSHEVVASTVLSQMTRLKQIAIDLTLSSRDCDSLPLNGPKVDAILEILEEADNQKIVIFSQYSTALHRLAIHLQNLKFRVAVITGEVERNQRTSIINQFQTTDKIQVLLINTQIGGVGIDLSAASIGIFLDKNWVPALNAQARARLIGQSTSETILIIELLMQTSIEEYIESVLDHKISLTELLLNYLRS